MAIEPERILLDMPSRLRLPSSGRAVARIARARKVVVRMDLYIVSVF